MVDLSEIVRILFLGENDAPLRTNIDTQNDGLELNPSLCVDDLEKVTPFKCGHFWYLKFLRCRWFFSFSLPT